MLSYNKDENRDKEQMEPNHEMGKIIFMSHQENMSVKCPYTPLLYRKNGVCRGIPIFLIFAPKHRLPRRGGSNVYPQSMF